MTVLATARHVVGIFAPRASPRLAAGSDLLAPSLFLHCKALHMKIRLVVVSTIVAWATCWLHAWRRSCSLRRSSAAHATRRPPWPYCLLPPFNPTERMPPKRGGGRSAGRGPSGPSTQVRKPCSWWVGATCSWQVALEVHHSQLRLLNLVVATQFTPLNLVAPPILPNPCHRTADGVPADCYCSFPEGGVPWF